jgi:predicted permease
MSDLRLALRTAYRNPGFTVAVVLTLAVGIGATTAIFSVANAVLLRPLPFAEPERLVQLSATGHTGEAVLFADLNEFRAVLFADLNEFRAQSATLTSIAGYGVGTRTLQNPPQEPERLVTISAERTLFDVLGVAPLVGRTFRPDDPPSVVVVGAGFWSRLFARDAAIVGKSIMLDGRSYTVIGVMPEEFEFPYRTARLAGVAAGARTELWLPFDLPPQAQQRGRAEYVVGRLAAAATVDAASSELNVFAARLAARFPETNEGRGVRVTPLAEFVAGPARNALLVLLGAASLVLLLACANIASLLLTRVVARHHEVAVRAALGARRGRLVRQFLSENLVLAFAGGIVALAISTWATNLIVATAAARIPRSWETNLDWRVFLFLTAICTMTGIVLGVAPAVTASRANARDALAESAGRASGSRWQARVRDVLVVSEVALAFVLLLAGSLLLRSLWLQQQTDTGFVADNVLTLHLSSRGTAADYSEIQRQVGQLPGVRAVGLIQLLPLQNWGWNGFLTLAPSPAGPAPQPLLVELRYVTPGYFQALGIPIRRGRSFSDADTSETDRVILINESLARQHFPNVDPVGQLTDRGRIVGVVGDVRQAGLDRPALPEIYYPIAQNVAARSDTGMSLVVSTTVPPASLVQPVREVVSRILPGQAVFQVQTMDRVIADSLADLRLYSWLIGLFATVAFLLSVGGIYAVVSYSVTSRTREFGIRLALGEPRAGVVSSVFRQGGMLVGLGLLIGGLAAYAATPVLQRLPVTIPGLNAETVMLVAIVLAAAGTAACAVPAQRVIRRSPVSSLRAD